MAFATAVTYLVLMVDTARAMSLVRSGARCPLLHIFVFLAAPGRALKPMPTQIIRARLLLSNHSRFILLQGRQSLRVHHQHLLITCCFLLVAATHHLSYLKKQVKY